jgi:hypothetical protein
MIFAAEPRRTLRDVSRMTLAHGYQSEQAYPASFLSAPDLAPYSGVNERQKK